MNTKVRAFTEEGMARFRTFLLELSIDASSQLPQPLLDNPSCSFELKVTAEVDPSQHFSDKMAFGRYLCDSLLPIRTNPEFDSHVGLWSWLAFCFFDTICPSDKQGARFPLAVHRYVLSQESNDEYRHLVRTPCLVYGMHGQNSAALLSGSPDTHGEASEQILAREMLRTNKGLFEAIDRLYVRRPPSSPENWHLKKGARGKDAPGTMRRLGKVVKQFDLTFDLYGMTGSQIFQLLPSEFNRFKEP